ncbi:zonular occludens toxin domain-containing protein [Dokdonella soli]|uniref:Zona occludens toxin N-terminal domain-containing protein n=1 Tax=Dokdonella soli TaxID=529810 RepID=A0ABP3TMN8_9GAMM
MIYLLTGQNGHGKTLRAMQLALQAKREGREVFVCNVKGVDYEKTGFQELAEFKDWQSLPDGAFVVVDEVWKFIPPLGPGKRNPEWVEQLAVHRHRGFDFVLVTQQGSQISTFVRGLIHEHTHVRRKFGFQKAVLLTWDRYQASTASNAELKEARRAAFSYPREVFTLYKSAEVHTVKRSLPWQVFAIPVLLILVVGAIWTVFHRFSSAALDSGKVASVATGSAGATSPSPQIKKPKSTEDYLQDQVPRVVGMPWSAPWHDGAKPSAEPDIYCVQSEAKGCSCYTEQITRLNVPILQCLAIARDGIYNPFRQPVRRSLNVMDPGQHDPIERSSRTAVQTAPAGAVAESLPPVPERPLRRAPFPSLEGRTFGGG